MPLSTATYPTNPDAWCETLAVDSGEWVPYSSQYSQNTLSIDNLKKVAGTASIKTHSLAYFDPNVQLYYGLAQFQLNANVGLFDGTQKNSSIRFAIQLGSTAAPQLTIGLMDVNGMVAEKTLTGVLKEQWLDLSFLLGPNGGWTTYGSFDWSKIMAIMFQPAILYIYPSIPPEQADFWIDNMHFEYEIVPTPFSIYSINQAGKTVYKLATLTSPQGLRSTVNLPLGPVQISPTGVWSITILSEDFIQWQDNNSTDKTRTFTANGTPIAFTAVFQGTEPPPPPPNIPPSAIVAVVAIGTLLIGSYLYYKRKR